MSFFSPRSRTPKPPGLNSGPPSPRSASPSDVGPGGKPLYLCAPFSDAALVKGNYKKITQLPKFVNVNEWVAVNIFDFYTNLNEFYGVIAERCTSESCPTMSAGPSATYTWSGTGTNQKRVALSAPGYIDAAMTLIQSLIDTEEAFPTKSSTEFHPTFPSTVRHMYRELLRIFAHIYHAHYRDLLHLRCEPHFNSLFAHFLAFGKEYQLLEEKDIKGKPDAPVGVGLLWQRWKEKGILE